VIGVTVDAQTEKSETLKDKPHTQAREHVPSLPRKLFVDAMPDKGLFGFVAVFGFCLILALKIYEYNSDFVAVIAVGLMVAYGLIAYRIPEVHIRLDRLGDNFYYLGFIYTLASLSAALLQLRSGPNIQTILGSFGIALITTIFGVAGRVIFSQMRTEIDEYEAIVRRDLVQTSNDLRAQLHISLRDFETFQKMVLQVTDESASRSDTIVAEQVTQVGQAAKTAAGEISNAFKRNQTPAKSLINAISDITSSVDELTKRLALVELPTDKINDQLKKVGDELENSIARISSSLDEFSKQLAGIKPPADRIQEQFETFGRELEHRLLSRLAAVVDEVEKQRKAGWFGWR
jgi:methyl-accepting chemotaxis protein